jgi:hypothetical protein
MSPKRGDAVAPPPLGDEWAIRFGPKDAADVGQNSPPRRAGNTRKAWDLMRTAPGCDPNERHTQLKGDYATGLHRGVLLPLWQIEVSDGGRIWYLIDEDNHMIWIQYASLQPPQENRVTIQTLRA